MMNILLIEDNLTIQKALKYSFLQYNYNLICTTNILETNNILNKEKIDLILLDISLPDGNGLSFFKTLNNKIPVIFLTANDLEENIVESLNLGAEDYITKPFSTKELLARVNRVLVRLNKNSIIKVKDISFDIDKMCVYKNNNKIELTSLEIKLLYLLFLNINKVVSRNTILDKIWEITGNDVDNHTITVYFKRIREKLNTDIIKTIKGIGYRIDEE